MIRKYHNHKLQKNPWYREEEPHNNHETPGRQTKQSNQLSLPHQDHVHFQKIKYYINMSNLICFGSRLENMQIMSLRRHFSACQHWFFDSAYQSNPLYEIGTPNGQPTTI